MIDISNRSSLKYFLFSSLYFSEGIMYGLGMLILPTALKEQGMDIGLATLLIGISWIPWIVKFFWGGIVDYFHKHGRKKFIIIGGAVGAICYFILTIVDPIEYTYLFIILLTIAHLGVVFLDVSADAWAIEISKPRERGKINASMFGGLFLGTAIATVLFGSIVHNIGFYFMFPVAGLITLLIIIYPLLVKEKIVLIQKRKIGKILVKEFKKKSVQIVSLFSPISTISFGLLTVVVPIYLNIEYGKNLGEIGLYATVGPLGTFIGAVVGGILADSWGRKKSLYAFFIVNIFIAIAFIFTNTWEMVVILYALVGFVHGGAYSAYGALLMDFTNPRVGATQYSIYTSLGNMGEMSGGAISGTLISTIGFAKIFLYSAWLYGPTMLALYLIRYKKRFNEK
jgi:MFS family permease